MRWCLFSLKFKDHQDLSKAKWYGSDGSVLNKGLVRNIEAAKFAVRTNFLNPIYGVQFNDYNITKYKMVESEIQEITGKIPSPYASVTYDAFWLGALTENTTLLTNQTAQSIKQTFERIADSYTGITGNTNLNANGDRKDGVYNLWAIQNKTGNSFAWKIINKNTLSR